MKNITKIQQKTYDYIVNHIESKGYPPTMRDIGDHFGVTIGTVYGRVVALKRKGFLKEEENTISPAKGKFVYVESAK